MMNGICYLSGQNVTSFAAKVTPEVTPEILCTVYMILTFLIDCYLVTSNIGVYTEIFSNVYASACVCARIYAHLHFWK